ncbi:MAG: amino acid racemase [Anaerovoracaceae bacterium]
MWHDSSKILGILGGMGPLATQLFYRMIIDCTDANLDQEHLDMIIFNHASLIDRTQAILSGHTEELYETLLEDAKRMEDSGITSIAIPCNTSHLFVDRMQQELSIPIINMIRETVKVVATSPKDIQTVAILATDGTVRSGLYQQACIDAGIQPVVPSQSSQKLVMKIIYDGVKNGGVIDYNDFIRIEGELASKGCQGAILACTELSCFKEQFNLPGFYIDAMEILAIRSIESCGKKVKEQYRR